MNFQYSIFISYRRNLAGKQELIRKVTALFEAEAHSVTNAGKAFFDEDSIKWGNSFDEKIYEGIVNSCFFIPFYHHTYLHEDNLWCAKELYRALKVEEKIQKTFKNYCFILPIVQKGELASLPNCIGRKNAIKLIQYEHHILGNKKGSAALKDLRHKIYAIFLDNFKLLDSGFKFSEICNDIEIPGDEEIKEWIREQKKIEKSIEASHLPILKKNGE